MKTLISSLLLMAFSTFHYGLFAEDGCTFPNNMTYTNTCNITSGLQEGIWEAQLTDQQTYSLQFYKSGQANWFVFSHDNEVALEIYNWEVVPGPGGQIILQLSNASQSHAFELTTACRSLELLSTSDDVKLNLQQSSSMPAQQYTSKQKMLTGKWGNTVTPLRVKSTEKELNGQAYLKYHFKEDGRFVKWLGNDQMSKKKEGDWVLSKDGKHVVLHFDSGRISVTELKYINMDELVLEYILHNQGEELIINSKNLFFNRN